MIYDCDKMFLNSSSCAASVQVEQFVAEIFYMVMDSVSESLNNTKSKSFIAEEYKDIRASRKGDSEAYKRLIERYQIYVGKIMWRFSRNKEIHEELVQEVFVEAYLSLGSYRAKAPFGHWVSRIATRVGYRYWKQRARHQVTENFDLKEWDQLIDDKNKEIEASDAAVIVHKMMSQLPPRDRLVLTLRYLEECDISETARRLGWTKTMVKVQSWRAMKKLEKLFSGSDWSL